MQTKNKKLNPQEVRRIIVHILLGAIFVTLININIGLDHNQLLLILLATLILAVAFSIICKYTNPKIIVNLLKFFDKPKDIQEFPGKGAIYYIIGMLVSYFLFEKNIASAAILILAFGDSAAMIAGRYFGKSKLRINPRKTLEGSISGIIFGTVAASFFVSFYLAAIGSVFAMIVEGIELDSFNTDDNLFIPVVSGTIITFLQILI